jgi:1-acyl-sn-glycerol-3-phosphate acyltransferase
LEHATLHKRVRTSGVNPVVYWIVRAVLQPFFHLYFRLSRIGRENIPLDGPVILACNHRSFLDPFVIATCARRPMYYVAKKELFEKPWQAWILNALGAFPVDRGKGDASMLDSAKAILARGDAVMIFVEGTRVRPGALGRPRRGVGRLALETGAPVVPVAVIGTEAIRKGWRIRPHKVRIRCGRPLTFPKVESASPQLAGAVTDRIWPCVMLQWEWLGGQPPLRRAAVIGAGAWGTSLAVALARAGLEVDLGCRTAEQAGAVNGARENARYLPGVKIGERVRALRASELELSRHDLVVFATPAASLPAVLAEHAPNMSERAAVLVASKGLVPPHGALPSAFVAERVPGAKVACVGGPAHARLALEQGAALIIGSADEGLVRQLRDTFGAAGFSVEATDDVVGVELAGCAKNAAALAAAAASGAGANAAGAAAGQVFSEVDALARAAGARPQTFAGLAGAGDLVATVMAAGSRNRRAGEMLARGVPGHDIDDALGQTAEAVATVPLLAERVHAAGLDAPALDSLAGLIDGSLEPALWTAALTEPAATRKRAAAA